MDATSIFVIGIAGVTVLAGLGVFSIAYRRDPSAGPLEQPITGDLDDRAQKRDRGHTPVIAEAGGTSAVATLEDVVANQDVAPYDVAEHPVPDPVLERQTITAAEYGVTRRQFFNRAIVGLFGGAFLGGLTLSFLAFLWPKLKGGFGTPIVAGSVGDLRREIVQSDGTISPKFIAAGQTWVVTFDEAKLPGSSFEGLPVTAGGGGGEEALMALWQRCVHLGCRVPACVSSQGFECPCHGSKYNFHGEYEDGPAPRNLDRFGVEVNELGELVVLTGDIFQTPRAKNKTKAYPQGPTCV